MALCFIAYRLCPNKKMNYFLMIHLELFELYWAQQSILSKEVRIQSKRSYSY